jgi:hypothetical protein
MRQIYGCVLAAAALMGFEPSSTMAGVIANPSFEENGVATIDLEEESILGWNADFDVGFGGGIGSCCASFAGVITEGLEGAGLEWLRGQTSPAGRATLWQDVDLTTADSLLFDYRLESSSTPFPSMVQAAFYIDDSMHWSSQTRGPTSTVEIDTSGLTGVHRLEFRLEKATNEITRSLRVGFYFDNLRITPLEPPVNLPQFADLIYNAVTGNVRLIPSDASIPLGLPPGGDGGQFVTFGFETESGVPAFNPAAATLPPGGATLMSNWIAWVGDPVKQPIDIGRIFPVGLNKEQLEDLLYFYAYVGTIGAGSVRKFDLVIVPEPVSAVCTGVAASVLLVRRRRAGKYNGRPACAFRQVQGDARLRR